jgi:hypothetical protein
VQYGRLVFCPPHAPLDDVSVKVRVAAELIIAGQPPFSRQ